MSPAATLSFVPVGVCVAVLWAVFGAAAAASAAPPPPSWPVPSAWGVSKWGPRVGCPAHAFVAYKIDRGWAIRDYLMIRRDGRAWLCSPPGVSLFSGKRFPARHQSFGVPRGTMTALVTQLRRIGATRPAPAPSVEEAGRCEGYYAGACDKPVASLAYRGEELRATCPCGPTERVPRTSAAKRALRQVFAILAGITRDHSPS